MANENVKANAKENTKENTKESTKEEKVKTESKIFGVWNILSYINMLFFVVILIYLAIDLSKKYSGPVKPVKSIEIFSSFKLDPFVVNLIDKDISYFLKLTLQLEPDKVLLYSEAKAKEPMIRDMIISILSQKKAEELRDLQNRDMLKKEILKNVNINLNSGHFKNVFFADFSLK